MVRWLIGFGCGTLALLATSAAVGQGSYDPPPTASPFAKGSWTLDTFAMAGTDMASKPVDEVLGGGLGVNYYFRDRVAFRTELMGLDITQEGNDAAAGGVSLMTRWHFLERDRFSLFLEGGFGVLFSDVSVPDASATQFEDGTHFNFTTQGSVGATYRLFERTHLIGAARYLHISNAGLSGDDENPGSDFVGGYLGLMWEF
ncbi:MAG: acyloxyacyl hydrolase [Planctomycetota bacterium]